MRYDADDLLKYAQQEEAASLLDRRPELAAVPIATIIGAGAHSHKVRGGAHGALTGLGAALGGAIGRRLTPEKPGLGLGVGLAGGGALSYLASQSAVDAMFPRRKDEREKDAAVIDELKNAKFESDRGNYVAKHQQLRSLMMAHPEDWHVDSVLNPSIVGVTHRPTGFRLHTHRKMLPLAVQEKIDVDPPVTR